MYNICTLRTFLSTLSESGTYFNPIQTMTTSPKQPSKFGRFLRQLREGRGLQQENVHKLVGVSKSQVSHFERGRRKPDGSILRKYIQCLSLTPREIKKLRDLAREEEIAPPREYAKSLSLLGEVNAQLSYSTVHIVADPPLELAQVSENNRFLMQLVEELKKPGAEMVDHGPRKFVYWTTTHRLKEFQTLLLFLIRKGISSEVIEETIEFVLGPEELMLMSFAVYLYPVKEDEFQYDGRILLRDNPKDSESIDVEFMGRYELQKVRDFLEKKYQLLKVGGRDPGYELRTPKVEADGINFALPFAPAPNGSLTPV